MKIDKIVLESMRGWMENQKDIPEGQIYLGNEKERYILGQPGTNNMLVVGVNPSTASLGTERTD